MYAPYGWFLMPYEYGFIVTDFVTKTIISSQNYCDMKKVYLKANVKGDSWESERMMGYFNDGRIVHAEALGLQEGGHGIQIKSGDYIDFDDFLKKMLGENSGGGIFDGTVELSVEPPQSWQIRQFNVRIRGEREEAYKAVKRLGFIVSEREEQGWAMWIRDKDFCMDDDDEVNAVLGD